jgi:hypothetical protein
VLEHHHIGDTTRTLEIIGLWITSTGASTRLGRRSELLLSPMRCQKIASLSPVVKVQTHWRRHCNAWSIPRPSPVLPPRSMELRNRGKLQPRPKLVFYSCVSKDYGAAPRWLAGRCSAADGQCPGDVAAGPCGGSSGREEIVGEVF